MSGVKYGSGKEKFVGQSIIYSFPIPLEAAQNEGAVIIAEDGQLYFSNGSDWIIPTEQVDIARPSPLTPTTAVEQTQMRLTNFRSPGGFLQTGIFFEVSASSNFDSLLFSRTVTSSIANMYQILYPEDGLTPGQTFWWRARYLGTDGTQSEFSLPFEQTYPQLISDPVPVTREGATTGFLQLTPFESAFALNYVETQIEIYQSNGTTLVQAFTSLTGASTAVPVTIPEGATYVWRARYGGRVGSAGPILFTAWTTPRTFLNGARSMVLIYDPALAVSRTISLPMFGTVNVTVNWGDGTTNTYTSSGVRSKTYAAGVTGLVTVTISGQLTTFGWGSGSDLQPGLVRVDNIGFGLGLTSLSGAFRGTTPNFVYLNPVLPPQVTDCSYMFAGSTLAADISLLDVSSVQNFSFMFFNSGTFNQNISGWNTSSATNMAAMFFHNSGTMQFNQPIGSWDVSNVTNMAGMFSGILIAFNQPIGNWNVSKVTTFENMFGIGSLGGTHAFNQNIGAWNTAAAVNMAGMFGVYNNAGGPTGSHAFNNGGSPTINNWNVSNVTNMRGMFGQNTAAAGSSIGTHAFNQPLNNWNVSSVTNFRYMFWGAKNFNSSLAGWNLSAASGNVYGMFAGACPFSNDVTGWVLPVDITGLFFLSLFNHSSIIGWNTAGVTNMSQLFYGARDFNQPIGNWNTAAVTDMSSMFRSTGAFNSPIGGWNTSSVTTMRSMFEVDNNASASLVFNQPINSWNVSSVQDMARMFCAARSNASNQVHPFNQPLDQWDVSNVTTMEGMFARYNSAQNSDFNQDLSAWDLRTAGVNLVDFFRLSFGTQSFSTINYSKLLTSWANKAVARNGPFGVTAGFGTRTYHNTVYAAGSLYENAVTGRAYLSASNRLEISGSSAANGNGTYLYNGTLLRYVNPNNWYFIKVAGLWQLRDNLDATQATQTSAGDLADPQLVTTWNGVLSAGTVQRTGAAWTITDGGLV